MVQRSRSFGLRVNRIETFCSSAWLASGWRVVGVEMDVDPERLPQV